MRNGHCAADSLDLCKGGTILGALLHPLIQDLVWSELGVAGSSWPGQLLVSQTSHPGSGNWNFAWQKLQVQVTSVVPDTTEFFPSQACAMHGAKPG